MQITEIIAPNIDKKIERPFFSVSVSAGFPSPADDHLDRSLDLNEYLIQKPAATYFVRVSGDSMIGAGIYDNDLLVVDKSLDPNNNDIVIAIVNGDFTLKRFLRQKNKIILMPENENYEPIEINDPQNFQIWGVVTSVVHKLR